MVEEAWRQCKLEPKDDIRPNDVVMAKLKGHPAWSAVVLEYKTKNSVKVEFFGAQEHEKFGFVNVGEITLFRNSSDVILLLLRRNIPNFKKGILQAENFRGVPQ